MSEYRYPLQLRKMISRVASPTFPVTVVDRDEVTLLVAREKLRIFSANTMHVFSAAASAKMETEQYQIVEYSGKGIDRAFRFVASADRRLVGKLEQRRQHKMVLVDILDAYEKPVASAVDNVQERLSVAMKSFFSGGAKKVFETTVPLQFSSPAQAPMFSLTPVDTEGTMQLSLASSDISAAHEQCMVLSAITLMLCWQHDASAGA